MLSLSYHKKRLVSAFFMKNFSSFFIGVLFSALFSISVHLWQHIGTID